MQFAFAFKRFHKYTRHAQHHLLIGIYYYCTLFTIVLLFGAVDNNLKLDISKNKVLNYESMTQMDMLIFESMMNNEANIPIDLHVFAKDTLAKPIRKSTYFNG